MDIKAILVGLFFIALAFIAALLDDSAEVRNQDYYPPLKQHAGAVNYGNR